MSHRIRLLARAVAGCAATVLLLPVAQASADVPAGFDLFETDPQSTHVDFSAVPIPPGFFAPGSDPFSGLVKFGGDDLGTFQGKPSGDADTVVRRLGNAVLPGPGSTSTIPIEIVALNLVSMEPITVTYGGGSPEFWDVRVVLAPNQMQGQMQIRQDSAQGGTFASFLPVAPRLTFTRLRDGQQQGVDFPHLPFQSQNTPWRAAGCELPALRIAGLNDVFCPGLTPQRQKLLTVEQAAFAAHGVYPVQPNLEHFKCYKLQKQPFRPRQVSLSDQFGQSKAKVRRRAELCNPVRKNNERLLNTRAHLQCYSVSGPSRNIQVAVRNQFGSQRLLVGRPQRLCLPTRKAEIAKKLRKPAKIKVPIDHFQCYGIRALTPLRALQPPGRLTLVDQFHRERVQLGKPTRLCAPVAKSVGRKQGTIQHQVRHLVCYRIGGKLQRQVLIQNQFEGVQLVTRGPRALCVPSLKTPF